MGMLGMVIAMAVVLILASIQLSGGPASPGRGGRAVDPIPVIVREHDDVAKQVVLGTGSGRITATYDGNSQLSCSSKPCEWAALAPGARVVSADFAPRSLRLSRLDVAQP